MNAKLKISDLSVGDWVRTKDCNVTVDIISSLEVVVMNDYGNLYACEIEDIKPIPITPEILEANGWRNDGMYARLRIDEHLHLEYYYHEHRLRKYFYGVDEWQNHAKVSDLTFSAHCYSVHQLQHALRLAGVDIEIVMPKK